MQLNLESRRRYMFVSNKLFFYANQIRIGFCHYLYEFIVVAQNQIRAIVTVTCQDFCVCCFLLFLKGLCTCDFLNLFLSLLVVFLKWISLINTFNHSLKKVNL